jgi:hypothetical protein
LVLSAVNPADNFPVHFRDENDVFFASAQLFEAPVHGFAIHRVAKNAAEFGHTARILGGGSSNNEIIHGNSRSPFNSNNRSGATLGFVSADLCTSLRRIAE